jgi:hypothetical protein
MDSNSDSVPPQPAETSATAANPICAIRFARAEQIRARSPYRTNLTEGIEGCLAAKKTFMRFIE